MKFPVPVHGSRMFTLVSLRVLPNSSCNTCSTLAQHEIHNLMGCVDNAERIGGLDRVALKEALVDGVQEVLFLAEILDGFGRGLDSQIKGVKGFEKFVPVKGFADQRVNNRFHLTRNHIAANEILTVEDRPNQPLGQKVL